jgi:hypothetical protein
MVRRRSCAVSNHDAPLVALSFETPLRGSFRMRFEITR